MSRTLSHTTSRTPSHTTSRRSPPPTDAGTPGPEPSIRRTADAAGPDPNRRAESGSLRGWLLGITVVAVLLVGGVPTVGASPAGVTDAAGSGGAATTIEAVGVGEGGVQQVNASFSQKLYETTVGDPVSVNVLVEEETYLLVGGNRLSDSGEAVGFTDVIRLTAGGDGDRMDVTINTRIAGTGADYVSVAGDGGTATSCSVAGCSDALTFVDESGDRFDGLDDLPAAAGADGLSRPLVAERYRLAAVENATFRVDEGGVVSPLASANRSNVLLVEPERHLGETIDLFTTMPAESDGSTGSVSALRSEGLERSAVTKGDRLVIGVDVAGIWGALSHFVDDTEGPLAAGGNASGDALRDLLVEEEGVDLRIEQTNPDPNDAPTRIGPSALEDATLLFESADEIKAESADPSAGRLYLVIDTSNDNAIGNQLDPGDEYRVTFELLGERDERYRFSDRPDGPFDAASVDDDTVPEQFPYFAADEAGVSVETSFSVADRYLRYDHTTDEGTVLADSGEITGETTLLPATEPSVAFSYDDGETTRVSESTVTIDDGGNFSVDVGLPGVPDGDRVLLTLRDDTRLHDSRTVIVATDAADPHRLRLTNTTTNLTVRRGESLAAFSTTIRNVGAVTDSQQLSLDIAGGAIVADRDVTVSPDTPQNETFGGVDVDLEPGQYPYTLAIDDDRINGSMTVETNPAVTRIDPDGNVTSAEAGSDGNAASAEAGSDGNRSVSGSDSATDRSTADDSANGTERNETDGAGGTDSADAAEAGTDAAGGAGGDTPSKTPPEGGAGAVLPIGVGTREVLGGTALVGVVHLLGHWV